MLTQTVELDWSSGQRVENIHVLVGCHGEGFWSYLSGLPWRRFLVLSEGVAMEKVSGRLVLIWGVSGGQNTLELPAAQFRV